MGAEPVGVSQWTECVPELSWSRTCVTSCDDKDVLGWTWSSVQVWRTHGSGVSYVPLSKPALSGLLKVNLVPQQWELLQSLGPVPFRSLLSLFSRSLGSFSLTLVSSQMFFLQCLGPEACCLSLSWFLTFSDLWKVFSCLCWSSERPGLLCPSSESFG